MITPKAAMKKPAQWPAVEQSCLQAQNKVGQRAGFTTRCKHIHVMLDKCHPWHLIGREAVPFTLPPGYLVVVNKKWPRLAED
ncbi:hypothetical protein UN63_14595 [Oceanisphaera arctica]|uniref:Uncharacterized protein n=2 Tax=Oceanisphaera arctica TaxID=641510 RepID=A0A2P5TIZ5_9GAMM|nr:hypothetical protein UN63_14595 [Oceanisphaera arctica]